MLTPLNGRVLIDPDEIPDTSEFGIILNDKRKEKPITGTVVEGGTDVAKGDRVIFSKFGYDEAHLDGHTYFLVHESCILAIFVDN